MVAHLLLALLAFQAAPVYHGQVELPITLLTSSAVSLPRGKYELEVRVEKKEYTLFLKQQKLVAAVAGKLLDGTIRSTIPLVGTILLWPNESDKIDTKSKLSPYLNDLSWKATLRFYKSADSASNEVQAVLIERGNRIGFSLYSAKP
jgi:hypothetical protein